MRLPPPRPRAASDLNCDRDSRTPHASCGRRPKAGVPSAASVAHCGGDCRAQADEEEDGVPHASLLEALGASGLVQY